MIGKKEIPKRMTYIIGKDKMMMTRGYIYKDVREVLWMIAFGVLLAACSSDDTTPDSSQESTDLIAFTRAVDDSYLMHENATLWLALTSGATIDSEGTYTYTQNTSTEPSTWSWTSTSSAKVWETKQYYLYGVANCGASCELTSSNYSLGATLTISDVEPLATSGSDPLVVVGVQGVTDPSTEWAVTEGNFGYIGVKENGKDNVHLLLDHLYSALKFSFSIDADYAKLRIIKLKKVSLKSSLTKKLNLTVNLASGATPITSVTAEQSTTDAATSMVDIFTTGTNDDGVDISQTWPENKPISTGCFAADFASTLSIECEYEVYDKASTPQHLATRKAVNSLSAIMEASYMRRGQIMNIDLKVVPTYLYILSDNDLDNPTIKISSN